MSLKLVLIVSLILSICAINSAQETDCKSDEEFNSCGSACPETCDTVINPDQRPQACTMQCVSGCFCRSGLVRNTLRHNECVSREECKRSLLRDSGNNSSNTLLSNNLPIISIVSSIALLFSLKQIF